MKKGLFALALAFVLLATYPITTSFSEERHDHCKPVQSGSGEVQSQGGNEASGHGEMQAGHEGMHHAHGGGEKLRWEGMTPHMVPMMKTMSGMSQIVADVMAKGLDDAKMAKVASIMDAMSSQMVQMYDMLNNRGATEGEMHSLHMHINETEKELKGIK